MKNDMEFGGFMAEVMNLADKLSFENSGRSLSDKYEASSTVIKMVGAVSSTDWGVFSALASLLSNASYFAFASALAVFAISPIGLAVAGALVYWGGIESIKLLYNNREIVADVKKIGDKFQPLYEECATDDERDYLAHMAANELYNL